MNTEVVFEFLRKNEKMGGGKKDKKRYKDPC